jgi:hypothetical protein
MADYYKSIGDLPKILNFYVGVRRAQRGIADRKRKARIRAEWRFGAIQRVRLEGSENRRDVTKSEESKRERSDLTKNSYCLAHGGRLSELYI